jgi:hypothetical protein
MAFKITFRKLDADLSICSFFIEFLHEDGKQPSRLVPVALYGKIPMGF